MRTLFVNNKNLKCVGGTTFKVDNWFPDINHV